jgi:mRNA-degrading endonuclease RelE of RelBE toxin-antitoxin system
VAELPADITIRYGPTYSRNLKRLKLKAASQQKLDEAWDEILKAVRENPEIPNPYFAGDPIPRNNREIYKLRVGDPDHQRGAQKGFRLIYWWRRTELELVGLYLYSKSEKEDVTQREIDSARSAFLNANPD